MEEEEEAAAAATSLPTVAETSANIQPSSPTLSTSSQSLVPWAVGARLESKARDSNEWFPAKVLEVEAEGRGVLVHYMQWNARHDEWIPSNSSRLRPVHHTGSGKSSRHNSGGNSEVQEQSIVPIVMPAHKDFKPGEKVMATWKLNRKYLATVIKFELSDGTYLVEFYDGVQCNVKPNNMRRPRKGEDDVDQQESLRINGAADNGSAENSDTEEISSSTVGSSGRRERKRKFDVKQLLNIRSVGKSLRSNSKEDPDFDLSPVSSSIVVQENSKKSNNEKRKRRPERANSQKSEETPNSEPTTPVINGSKARSKLDEGPALVSGKRERRKKKFWDDEVDSSSGPNKAKELSSPNLVSSALKRKSSGSVSNPIPKKAVKKSEKVTESPLPAVGHNNSNVSVKEETSQQNGSTGVEVPAVELQKPSGKENGKVLPYLQLDLTDEPELIAEKMIEGVNIPGMGQPIPVDSSSLPEGWEKRVIQRRIGITKGKWDVFITNPETGKSFRSKTELQKHLDERKLPYTSDAFDFSLDDNLKRLRQIWKQYKVKPFLNNPKGTGSSGNFKHVPAKITQVTEGDSPPKSGNHISPAQSLSVAAPASSASNKVSALSPGSAVPLNSAPFNNSENDSIDLACLAEIAKESETGQGLRCSIAKCGKLFRNNRLLRQHVKHYHPKVYESLLCKHPQIGDDISEPTSPEARRLSEGSDLINEYPERRRVPSNSELNRLNDEDFVTKLNKHHASRGPGRPLKKSSILDEEAPLSSMYNDQDAENHADDFYQRRTRNDSVLSSINSDTEELSVGLELASGPRLHNCPPTPPTFRLSKRRQAQMKKRVQQPVIRVSKIEDTPLGREYLDSLASTPLPNNPSSSSTTTSPTNNILADSSQLTPSSYPPSEMDASIAGSEHLTSEELVNCTCRRLEEDGLMIQCDICLCWQHGYCVGIEDEDPVPEKHVCETCRQPPGGRTEAKFSLDQDWLKEGKLPSCESVLDSFVKKKSLSAVSDRETAFRKLSELMADLANLDKVLHGLRVKLHVASQPSNSKVFMWSSVWSIPSHQPMVDDMEMAEPMEEAKESNESNESNGINRSAIDPHVVAEKLSLLANNENIVEKPKVNGIKETDNSPPPSESANASESKLTSQVADNTKAEECSQPSSQPLSQPSSPLPSDEDQKVLTNGKNEEEKKANGNNEDFDANFIPSLSEVERLLPSVIQEIAVSNKSSSGPSPANSNVPMSMPKRLDRDECRLNLLQHIEGVQAEIENRYNAIESAISKIEAMPGALNAGFSLATLNDAKMKAKLNKLIQDLAVARQLMWTL